MANSAQIFQTTNPARWKRVKWTFRILLFVSLFILSVVVLAIYLAKNPASPAIVESTYNHNAGEVKNYLSAIQKKKYTGFREFLEKKSKDDSVHTKNYGPGRATDDFIRGAFYTPWQGSKSIPSLETYGNKLNMVFPEWFFIDTANSAEFQSRIDSAGLAEMRKKGIKIMPILTNFNSSKKDFDGSLLHAILNNPQKQQTFIQQLLDTLTAYNLQGINIDFEEINEPTNIPLTNFQKNLYAALHQEGFIVSQDVAAMNNDYDYKQLASFNDYIILMAYDQFSDAQSGPGPVSAQKWIEQVLDNAASKIDSKKIILGLAGYGYDWMNGVKDGEQVKKDSVVTLTYSEAVDKAKLSNATIEYDNDSYNLHFSYTEKNYNDSTRTYDSIKHTIWFTDAVTTFNIMRFADEYGLAGTVLWRLGSEDPRMWNFYNLNLSNEALATNPFDFNLLATVPINPNQKPTPTGEGELLNILYSPQEGKIQLETDSAEQLISEQVYHQLPSGYVYEKFGEDKTAIGPGHKLILTFDDGPDDVFTPKILDILEREKVPATFFVVGLQCEKNIPLLKRIYKDGYEIGNHTFTHNNVAKMSPERAEIEMRATRLLIEAITGRSTILFRAPYNADSEPQSFEEIEPLARSKKDNYITVGESIDPNDWDTKNTNADSIVNRTIRLAEATEASIILLHDAGGESRQATVDALPQIIQYFKNKGCQFTTVANLMGKTKNDVMPLVKQDWKTAFDNIFLETLYWAGHIIFALFLIGIFLSVGRIIFIAALASLHKQKEKNELAAGAAVTLAGGPAQLVSIIVPAYNEELNAVNTIKSLLLQNYPALEIVFVDDGSKDNTYATVKAAFEGNPVVKVFTKPNGGKASALNVGIEKASGRFVVCIDADTQLKADAVTELMKKFTDEQVGAVAGNVKTGNEINMITRWQSIEYITSQNFDRRAFDYLNCITVVPGAIGAFRKKVIEEAGGFTTDTLAEDCDLTMRLHKLKYTVKNCSTAISYTEVPETMKQFMKQRFRWSFGVIQCFWKHRDALFNPRYKTFGTIAMPHILIFQMILPFLAPLADLVLVLSLIAAAMGLIPASAGHILLYYAIFSVVDMAGAALAFAFEKEDYKKLLWMIPQRFIYRQLMYYILFKSFNKALKGELQGWGVLKRTGNVKQAVTA
jgi:peptidoglycan-N-acetylglucosamine deacetylase